VVDLLNHLGKCSALQLEQREYNRQSLERMTRHERSLSTTVTSSSTSIQRGIDTILGQQQCQIEVLRTNYESMATTLGAILRSGEEAQNDGQSESFKTLEQLARIRSLLENDLSSNILDDSDPQLSEAMSRLYAISKDHRGDFDMTGEEAQLLTDDVVLVLQSLLDEVSPPSSRLTSLSRKRKRRSALSEEAASIVTDIDDQRLVRRARGILESTQSVAVRASSMLPYLCSVFAALLTIHR
jgi:hypothetical protein